MVWLGDASVDAKPSPNVQAWLVIVPVDWFVNVTASGTTPLVGLPMNSATGAASLTAM